MRFHFARATCRHLDISTGPTGPEIGEKRSRISVGRWCLSRVYTKFCDRSFRHKGYESQVTCPSGYYTGHICGRVGPCITVSGPALCCTWKGSWITKWTFQQLTCFKEEVADCSHPQSCSLSIFSRLSRHRCKVPMKLSRRYSTDLIMFAATDMLILPRTSSRIICVQ